MGLVIVHTMKANGDQYCIDPYSFHCMCKNGITFFKISSFKKESYTSNYSKQLQIIIIFWINNPFNKANKCVKTLYMHSKSTQAK